MSIRGADSLVPVGQTIVLCGLPSCVRPEPGTGPCPFLFRVHESRGNRITLDIPDHFIQLSRRAYPVIVGLILPKSPSAAPQHSIRNSAGPALKPAHNVRHRDMRLPHYMHMVGHDCPGVKVVGMADGRTIVQGILDNSGDALIPQPERSRTASVEPLVANVKRSPSCVFRREDLGRNWRVRTGQTPGHKNDTALRKPMRMSAAVRKHGRPQKTTACPKAKNLTALVGQTSVFCGLPITERPQ